ncbi:MAG TPA: PIN domain-containing protein [Coriobacteriia bacterium]
MLIYALDTQEIPKSDRARGVIAALSATGAGFVSTQVLAEFMDVVVRRPRFEASREWAAERVEEFSQNLAVVSVDEEVLMLAVAASVHRRWRFYDAQIWAAAFVNGIPLVLSEDFGEREPLDGVTFLDPFTEGFTLEMLETL